MAHEASFAIATRNALLIARPGSGWKSEVHLEGRSPESLAVDPGDPTRLYVGTWGHGLWRSFDAGRTWEPVGEGIPHDDITAVAVDRSDPSRPGTVYVGTEPSSMSRSEDGGESWRELGAFLDLPSASQWSFPPKPDTHHVRWIETDPGAAGKLYVAIEAGALVRTLDGGDTWLDRVEDGPFDTHTAATHRRAPGLVVSAAGDGYYESRDGGESWSRPMDGLGHRYLVGVALDPGDPETVVVSAAAGPYVAYRPSSAEAYVYRKSAGGAFETAMKGLPGAAGTVASRFATVHDEPGVLFAVNNHGLFRSQDGGATWEDLPVEWPEAVFRGGVDGLVAFSA